MRYIVISIPITPLGRVSSSQSLNGFLSMSDDLEVRVRSWLNKQGFPLEMEVASIAKEAGFDVGQSESYLDPQTGEAREIDLILSKGGFTNASDSGYMTYKLYVECKSSKDKPWLLFSTLREEEEHPELLDLMRIMSIEESVIANEFAHKLVVDRAFAGEGGKLFPNLMTQPMIGYGLTQAFSEAQDTPFKALMSSTKAALALTIREDEMGGHGTPFNLAFPVVVIDVPLFCVSYNSETSQIHMTEIEIGNLLWKHSLSGRYRFGIYIVTKKALKEFFERCYASAQWLLNLEEEVLDSVGDNFSRD